MDMPIRNEKRERFEMKREREKERKKDFSIFTPNFYL